MIIEQCEPARWMLTPFDGGAPFHYSSDGQAPLTSLFETRRTVESRMRFLSFRSLRMTVGRPFSRADRANPLPAPPEIKISLLTGGVDRPYALGLAMALALKDISLEVIGNSVVDTLEMHRTPNVGFLSLYWEPLENLNLARKAFRVLLFYSRLVLYAAGANAKIIHILWNNKVQLFDRTLLMLYYKALGKKIVLTAHNVNAAKRDSRDSKLNRLTLCAVNTIFFPSAL